MGIEIKDGETKEGDGMEKQIEIGICDDNPMAVQQLREMTEEYLEKEGIEAIILAFNSGTEVLETSRKPDILFLDIEMPKEDGIETGKKLREQGCDCRIIMATSMVERFKEGFHIGASRFVTKPFDKEEVWEALGHALQGFIGRRMVELYEKRIPYRIEERQILYIQAYNSYAEAVVKGRRLRIDNSIVRMVNELDSRLFCQASRAFLVNLAHIEDYDEGTIHIAGEKIQVSRRNRKKFEQAYREYDLNYRQ